MIKQTVEAVPREGDVYAFQYSEQEYERAHGHDLRWAFDGQLVFRDGVLCDTYWGMDWRGDNGRHFKWAEANAKGTLTFICNLNDVEKVADYDFPLYAQGDAFNLSHQRGCYKYFVRRKGAKKDKALMLAALDAKVQAAKEEIKSATWHLEYAVRRRAELAPRVEAGEEITV